MNFFKRYFQIRQNRLQREDRAMRTAIDELGITHQSEALSRRIATMFSFFIPGSGHIYRGYIGLGFIWLAIVVILYKAGVAFGFATHICCVVQANSLQVDKDMADYIRSRAR